MVNHHCSALNCTNTRKKCPGMTFVRFPKDQTRCNMWIHNVKRPDLLKKNADSLYRHAILCEKHFEDNQWMNKNRKHHGLTHTAIPTILSSGNPSHATRERKRRKSCEETITCKCEVKVKGILVKDETNLNSVHEGSLGQNDELCVNDGDQITTVCTVGRLDGDVDKLKVQAAQQQCHKINASIVNMGGDRLYLVVPVPPSSL